MVNRTGSRRVVTAVALTAAVPVCATGVLAQAHEPPPADEEVLEDLAELDLEALLQVKVTSVAGRAQSLLDTPAALTVITAEDIRRAGHRSLPEALRMVPGFTVGRISPGMWAIGSRGFADRFSNDLLVLIDGRTVYDPLFSGVFWNVQDVLLEDLDRIEVIRGPGATLWGANAVNGVINVTTKSAHATHGLFLQGGGGDQHEGFGAVRYGAAIDEDTSFRVWSKFDSYDSYTDPTGRDRPTDWSMYRAGLRVDRDVNDELSLTLQGDVYATGRSHAVVRVPIPGHFTFRSDILDEQYQGGNVLVRATSTGIDDDGWSVQAYYDRTKTRGGVPGFEVRRHTVDLDYRQYGPLDEDHAHVLMWGLGYRHTRDATSPGETLTFTPDHRSLDTFSGFIQDTIRVVPDELTLMIGSKFEHNDHTGFEYQPGARLSWTPDADQTLWSAVSRAVRTPSRIADDVNLITAFADTGLLGGGPPSGTFVPLRLLGDPGVESEKLVAYEIGYRRHVTDDLSMDVAAFYNDYEDAITLGLPAGTIGNRGSANTYGVEISGLWLVSESWSLAAAYSFIEIDFDSPDGNAEERETPQQQFNVRSRLDLTDDLELNSAVYFVDRVPDEGAREYLRLDVGLTWRPRANVEIAVWGQNLLDPRHLEFGDDFFQDGRLEVPRAVYGQISFRF